MRLQWDPDHGPTGGSLERRAIQLGLQGEALRRYSKEWLVDIKDITALRPGAARIHPGGSARPAPVPRTVGWGSDCAAS